MQKIQKKRKKCKRGKNTKNVKNAKTKKQSRQLLVLEYLFCNGLHCIVLCCNELCYIILKRIV